jgi:hypothetical protein
MALKQHSFLGNDSETENGTTCVARERFDKHVLAAMDKKINGVVCLGRAEKL